MAYRMAPFLIAFGRIFRTVVQQLIRFNWQARRAVPLRQLSYLLKSVNINFTDDIDKKIGYLTRALSCWKMKNLQVILIWRAETVVLLLTAVTLLGPLTLTLVSTRKVLAQRRTDHFAAGFIASNSDLLFSHRNGTGFPKFTFYFQPKKKHFHPCPSNLT